MDIAKLKIFSIIAKSHWHFHDFFSLGEACDNVFFLSGAVTQIN